MGSQIQVTSPQNQLPTHVSLVFQRQRGQWGVLSDHTCPSVTPHLPHLELGASSHLSSSEDTTPASLMLKLLLDTPGRTRKSLSGLTLGKPVLPWESKERKQVKPPPQTLELKIANEEQVEEGDGVPLTGRLE